ncbi:hypothetical protein LTR62_008649 [Meristemomyces frigidus]|uniref:Telomerase reverse transcriptase n=1 Tax=Meristemomyces frigidus TaxID=1508187 RepID=A0AAN7TAU3_9PEZI|nr:hypothetical protein LTR62_008649 [Meristemomyces frigidus]
MKRKRKSVDTDQPHKHRRLEVDSTLSTRLLAQYYPHVSTLRTYLCSKLSGSKKRARTVAQYGRDANRAAHVRAANYDVLVTRLLDTTLVGEFQPTDEVDVNSVERDIVTYTQQVGEDSTTEISPTQGAFQQAEIVSFVLWKLFSKPRNHRRVSHLLCRGYQRSATASDGVALIPVPSIPGVVSNGQKSYSDTLRQPPWNALPALLGRKAESVISNMLIDCGIFVPVGKTSNLLQLSGVPMSELKALRLNKPRAALNAQSANSKSPATLSSRRGLSEIRFVRHRMFYARTATTSKGQPRMGLSHGHVLNRLRDISDEAQTLHCTKYMFPRQFGLHNVFDSRTDPLETAQPFNDYTLRDREIATAGVLAWRERYPDVTPRVQNKPMSVPKRLRGAAVELVRRLRKKHLICPYYALLQHYCPRRESFINSHSTMQCASTTAEVSSYCCAITKQVFPRDLWGDAVLGRDNERSITRKIDQFVRLRRYENMSMHDVMQGISLNDVEWLVPPGVDREAKVSRTDLHKRRELMCELLYYLFDSFLIPLIRGTFHVTESSVHRNQLFYFRHDTWKALTEPILGTLKVDMVEECSEAAAKGILAQRSLGVSQIRLLPKEKGMRPIINLRRRMQRLKQGQVVLGRSINSLLTPSFCVLNYEKSKDHTLLQSALFSIDDIFPRLQAYRSRIAQQLDDGKPLYFAKVDVQSCFDTIPQDRLMALVRSVISNDEYSIAKHARAKLVGGYNTETPGFGAKPSWKFLSKANASDASHNLEAESLVDAANGRTNSVYVDGTIQKRESRKSILDTLDEHVRANLIRIGKRYYRQKEGIAQGSIVSSLLCSYLYAELERTALDFLSNSNTILLRLIDDFLVISTNKHVAKRFLQVMHAGIPEFGVRVKPEKTRANFEFDVDGSMGIELLPQHTDFPYCGNTINTVTLDIRKDRERRLQSNMADSITVEYSSLPGQAFYRKIVGAVRLQMHAMLFSTEFNSLATVHGNIYHAFIEVAHKCYHYVTALKGGKRPGDALVIRTVDDSIKLACVLIKSCKSSGVHYECSVGQGQTRWLACTAFCNIFRRRQTKFHGTLRWLDGQLKRDRVRRQRRQLETVTNQYERAFGRTRRLIDGSSMSS